MGGVLKIFEPRIPYPCSRKSVPRVKDNRDK